MAHSKRKALKELTNSKVVNISDYRDLKQGREAQSLAFISKDENFFKELQEQLPSHVELVLFESRFAFEQALKSKEWDSVILDERSLSDEALQLCEKLKRQNQMEELILIIISEDSNKERVRKGLELGCDEWMTQVEPQALARILSLHLSFT